MANRNEILIFGITKEKQEKEDYYMTSKYYQADKSVPVLLEPVVKDGQHHAKGFEVFSETHFDKNKEYFHIMPHEESHTIRRRAILEKHPEIKELYTKDPLSAVLTLAITVFQLATAYYIQNESWPVFLTVMYVVGATLNHTMQALVHDLTHFTAFDSIFLNRIFSFMSNVPTCIPSAMAFQYYHREHHLAMGDPAHDTDLPTKWEIRTFNRPWKKLIFLFLHPLFYTIRPFLMAPKPLTFLEIVNAIVIFTSDYLIYKYLGPYALVYLAMAAYMSMGLHPMAMHTIAEHYEFVKGQESFDYFGPANFLNLNLGYHIEHHDFPLVPWRFLPKVRAAAPEFYETIPSHTSYLKVAFTYIFDNDIGPYSRIDTTEGEVKKVK